MSNAVKKNWIFEIFLKKWLIEEHYVLFIKDILYLKKIDFSSVFTFSLDDSDLSNQYGP